MNNTLLTPEQSACRAAHEQVQMLADLYRRLLGDEDERYAARLRSNERTRELEADRSMLARKLEQLDLLRTEPDPEREGLLEAITELKRAFGADDGRAVRERLIAEEQALLRLTGELAAHDGDRAIADSIERSRTAIARLEALSGPAGGDDSP